MTRGEIRGATISKIMQQNLVERRKPCCEWYSNGKVSGSLQFVDISGTNSYLFCPCVNLPCIAYFLDVKGLTYRDFEAGRPLGSRCPIKRKEGSVRPCYVFGKQAPNVITIVFPCRVVRCDHRSHSCLVVAYW